MDKFQTLREKDNPSNNVYPNVKSQNIPRDAITSEKIVDGAVTGSKIANFSITSSKLNSEAVTGDKIAPNAVSASRLASNAVTSQKIANQAVTERKLNIKQLSFIEWCALQGEMQSLTWQNLGIAFAHLITQTYGLTISLHYETGANQREQVFLGVDASGAPYWLKSGDFTEQNFVSSDADVVTFMGAGGDGNNIFVTFID